MIYAKRKTPVPGAQWTGIVTQIAIDMLESGKVGVGSVTLRKGKAGCRIAEWLLAAQVEAVVCVQSQDNDRFAPKPVSTL